MNTMRRYSAPFLAALVLSSFVLFSGQADGAVVLEYVDVASGDVGAGATTFDDDGTVVGVGCHRLPDGRKVQTGYRAGEFLSTVPGDTEVVLEGLSTLTDSEGREQTDVPTYVLLREGTESGLLLVLGRETFEARVAIRFTTSPGRVALIAACAAGVTRDTGEQLGTGIAAARDENGNVAGIWTLAIGDVVSVFNVVSVEVELTKGKQKLKVKAYDPDGGEVELEIEDEIRDGDLTATITSEDQSIPNGNPRMQMYLWSGLGDGY